jgi:hypothetical protein
MTKLGELYFFRYNGRMSIKLLRNNVGLSAAYVTAKGKYK